MSYEVCSLSGSHGLSRQGSRPVNGPRCIPRTHRTERRPIANKPTDGEQSSRGSYRPERGGHPAGECATNGGWSSGRIRWMIADPTHIICSQRISHRRDPAGWLHVRSPSAYQTCPSRNAPARAGLPSSRALECGESQRPQANHRAENPPRLRPLAAHHRHPRYRSDCYADYGIVDGPRHKQNGDWLPGPCRGRWTGTDGGCSTVAPATATQCWSMQRRSMPQSLSPVRGVLAPG